MQGDRKVLLLAACFLISLSALNAFTIDGDTNERASSVLFVVVCGGAMAWSLPSRGSRLAGLVALTACSVALAIIGDNAIQTAVCAAMALLAIGTLVSELRGEGSGAGSH